MSLDDGMPEGRRDPGRRLDVAGAGRGDLLAAAGALVLLVLMFALKWYGPGAITSGKVVTTTVNGWDGLIHLRWLMLLTILSALLVGVIRATRRAPALPIAAGMIVPLLGVATLLWLGYRVFISIPPGQKPAAYLGLACVLAIVIGGGASLRQQWTSHPDPARPDNGRPSPSAP